MNKTGIVLLTSLFVSIAPLDSRGDDWPWWRGPNFDGKASSEAPLRWSETRNVVWKVKVPGRGHSSPIVAADRIYLTTSDVEKETQSALCFDRSSGKILWTKELHRGGFMPHHPQNSQASQSAAFDGERVFFTFPNADAVHVSALDRDGEIVWKRALGPFGNHEGYGSSPVIYQQLVIVTGDNRRGSFLAALDRKSGDTVWQNVRPNDANFCTPVVTRLAGRQQLLVSGLKAVQSFDPATGKLLWHCPGPNHSSNSMAFSDNDPGYVIASGGVPVREILCIRADGSGDITDSHIVWRSQRMMPYVPSPVYHEGHFYLLTDTGIAQCLVAETGDVAWRHRLGDRFKSSLTLAGGRIYATSETGTTHVFAARPEFEQLAENTISEGAFATPAICDGRIYLRTYHHLYCIGTTDAQTTAASLGPRTTEFPATAYNRVHHVSATTGSDETGDGSGDKPWKTIRHALASIKGVRFDSRHAVVVSAGVYRESPIALRSDIDLYGGFSPSDWGRDVGLSATVLDGEKRHRVVVGADSTRLDGFTVTGGRIEGNGGAILIENAAMTISNNVFSDNATLKGTEKQSTTFDKHAHSGGAVACLRNAAPVISHNIFTKNFTEYGQGGAIAFLHDARRPDGTRADVRFNVFVANDSGREDQTVQRRSGGAAVSCSDGAAPVLEQNVFVQNHQHGPSLAGAIYAEDSAVPVIRVNWIVGNTADDGAAIAVRLEAEPLIERNIIVGNGTTGADGGALRLAGRGRARILANVLAHTTAGAAVTCEQSSLTLVNNTVVANRGDGLVYVGGADSPGVARFSNNILRAGGGRALFVSGQVKPEVSHSIVEGGFPGSENIDVTPGFVDDGVTGMARVKYDDGAFESTVTLDLDTIPNAGILERSLVGRPIRVGTTSGARETWGVVRSGPDDDGTLRVWGNMGSGQKNGSVAVPFFVPLTYHLRSDSPCIGKGSTESASVRDLDGDHRRSDSDDRVDIGADEY